MQSAYVDRLVAAYRLTLVDSVGEDAQSGAGVHRVRTSDGASAYLKATPAELGDGPRDFARRELTFYAATAPGSGLRTAQLLAHRDDEDGVALLLTDAGRPVPVAQWDDELRHQLAEQVAALHAVAADGAESAGLDAAMAAFDPAVVEPFWGPVLPGLDALLAERVSWREEIATGPRGFVHGDLHAANVLRDGSGPVSLVDWQFCGPGPQLADLAFPRVRASTAGLSDRADLLPDCRALGLALPADAETQVDRIELAYYLYAWTPYARFNDAAAIARVHARARLLVARSMPSR